MHIAPFQFFQFTATKAREGRDRIDRRTGARDDIQAFCAWLTVREQAAERLPAGFTYRLPSDHEWSCAAGIGNREDAAKLPVEKSQKIANVFPWGGGWPPPNGAGNYAGDELRGVLAAGKHPERKNVIAGYNDGFAETSPVGSFAANRFGLYDMGGNVWQWCSDWYAQGQNLGVQRGASWNNNEQNSLLLSYRLRGFPDANGTAGFRCVLAPVASTPAAAAQLSPSSEPWRDGMKEVLAAGKSGVRADAQGVVFQGQVPTILFANSSHPNGAVRALVGRVADSEISLRLKVRSSSKGVYMVHFSGNIVHFSRSDPARIWEPVALRRIPLAEPLAVGADAEIELRVVGNKLTAKANGKEVGGVEDSTLTSGEFGVWQDTQEPTRETLVRAIQYLVLPDDASASAAVSVTPATATKDKPFMNTLGMKFVPVPIIGGPTDKQRVLFSVWDTRKQDYEIFARETKHKWRAPSFPQEPTHPAVMVNWDDVQQFCQWLTSREQTAGRLPAGWRYRLPTDHEWSCAAGIGEREDAAALPSERSENILDVFPWGTQWPPPNGAGNYAGEELRAVLATGNYSFIGGVIEGYNDGFVYTSPVGSFPANQFGLFDLSGNVFQCCEDWFDKDQNKRAIRGSYWGIRDRNTLLSSHRGSDSPEHDNEFRGFRCVLDVSAR
jgi:formylglycine-generating enzyme required for sulfatase activity